MNRRLLVTAALVAAFGCGCATSPSIVLGEGYSSSPVTLPDDEPAEVPEGYEEGDDSEFSPAHPLHLKKKKKPGVEENI
jgi:hypothetical protein